jgi:type II secretion system protein D
MSKQNLKRIGALSAVIIFVAAARAQNTNPPAAAAPKPTAVAPATNAAVASPRNIRFQFDGIPYADVVERFAQMAGKPLLANTNIQGTLSYNDPRPYTYEEALDVLNVILAMKDLMVVESGNYLQLVPFKQLPQMPLKILRGTDRTGDVRPGEVVTVVLDLKSLDAKEVADSIVPMLSNAGSVAPLSRGRGLILTDRLQSIQRIKYLLAQIDSETASQRQMKTFTLLHSSGAVIADLINRTFGIATAPKRTQYNPNSKQLDTLPPDPSDYVTAVYDDASRTLVLFGPPQRIELAEDLISRFEDKEGPNAGDVRIYFPQTIKADELATMIRQAVPGVAAANETAAGAATKARVIPDPAQNRLIVSAPTGSQLDEIERLINKVDKPIHGTGGQLLATKSQIVQITKVFRPRSTDVTAVAKILSEALSKRLPTGVTVPTANVSVEPGSQSVVVTGSPGDVQTAVDIVTQLETGSTLPVAQQTKFIDIGTVAEAKRLLPLIEQIYRSQVPDALNGQVAHAKIIADAEVGRLIVTASEDHLRRIEGIVQQLRAEKPKRDARSLRIIALKHLKADTALASLNPLVSERMTDRRFEDVAKPSLVSDAVNNRLLVTATEDQFKEIEQVVKVVDIAPEAAKREMAVLPVQSKPASELITLVSTLLTQLGDDQSNPQLSPKLISDPSGKQIIALATTKDLERIRTLIQQLDTATVVAATRQFKGVELFGRKAAEFTPLVQQLYSEQLKGLPEPAGGGATVIAEAKDNRIMVSGPEKEITRVEAIIRQLDPAEKKPVREETRVIRLKTAVATELATLVEKSVNAQSQQVRVMVDARSNSLVVNGEPASVEAASQIIQQLDTRSDTGPREMRIIDLRSGDAATIAPMVTSLFTDMSKDQRGTDYVTPTKVIPDSGANRLIVTGPREDIAQVTKLVQQLDQTPEQSGSARVFRLQTASAMTLAPIVSNAMLRFDARGQAQRKVTVSADEKSNSLIVTGGRTDVQDAAVIVSRLDGESDGAFQEEVRELRIVQVNTSDPDQLAGLAMRVFAAQNLGRNITNILSITPEPSGKRLIVLGPRPMLAQVEQVVTSLDQPADKAARELHSIDLKNSTAQELFPTVSRIYGEQSAGKSIKAASIYPDASGTRLTVWGTKDQATSIRQIVETLQLGLGTNQSSRETRAFEIGTAADVQRLLPLIQQLYQDQWRNKPNDPADAQIVGDARAGKIIVSGKPEHIKQIELIINQIGTSKARPPTEARETRVYDLTTANAIDLATTVRTLYTEQAKVRLGTLPPETLILPDVSANRLIIAGDTSELAAIEEIIQKLDKVSAQSASVRVFKLKSADPDKVMEILSSALVRYDASGRQQKRVSVSVDPKTRTIIATGDPKDLQGASVIIEQLDTQLGAQPERKMKVVSLTGGRATDLAAKLRQLYADQMKSKSELGTADALILEDTTSNQFILAATEGQLKLLEQILADLQSALAAQSPRDSRIYDLTTASALELATTVRTLYQEQAKARPGAPVNDAVIMSDAGANRLIVSAATNELDVIEEIVKKLDKVSAQSATTRVFKLKSAEPDKVMEILTTALVRYDAYGRPQKRASVVVDAKTRTLIATGDPKELQAASVIIDQIDALGAQTARKMKVVPVKAGRAGELATKVRQLYQDQAKGLPELSTADILILDDAVSNQLVLTGDDAQLALIDRIISQLQEHVAKQAPRESKVFDVGLPDEVTRLQPLVQQLYLDKWKDKAAADPADAQIVPDTKNGRLIVSGRPDHVQEIGAILTSMIAASTNATPADTRVYDLTSSSAIELATTVKTLYQEQIKTRASIPAAQPLILPDAAANRLVVSGATNELAVIENIVKKLDKADGQSGTARVFKLKSAEPAQIAALLSSALVKTDVYGRQLPRVSVGADDRNSMLIVSGEAKDLQAASVIIEQMDAGGVSEARQMRIIPLKSGLASDVSTRLRQVYTDQLKGQGKSGTPDGLILGDDASNRLIITASESHLKLIESLVKQMEEAGAGAGRQLRILNLQNQSASSVAAMISQLYSRQIGSTNAGRRLTVTASPDDRTLVVDGTGRSFEEIEQLVKTLDKAMADAQNVIQTVQLKKAQADGIADAVQKTIAAQGGQTRLQKVSVTGIDGANSLLINGPADAVQEVLKIVHELDTESEDGEIKVRVYKLENGNVKEIHSVLNQVLQGVSIAQRRRGGRGPSANISVDDRSSTLIVSGSEAHFKVVEQLLKTLDKVPEKGERDVQFVWLRNARAVEVVSKIEPVFSDRPQAERPVIEADTFANSITLIGRRSDVAQARDLISRLDETSKDSSLQVRLRPVDRLPAEQMARMLQNIYPQMAAGRLRVVDKLPPPKSVANTNAATTTNTNAPAAATAPNPDQPQPEVVIAVDKQANALLLSGPANELDQIERIVSELSFSFMGNDAEFRLFALKEADPVIVARTVNQLFRVDQPQPQQPQQGQPQQPQPAPAQAREPRITVVAEPRTRSVIVRAKPADFTLVEALINQLDASQVTAQLDYRVITLTNALPEKVLPLVQEMVTQLRLARPGDPLSVTVDGRSHGLLLIARAPLMEQVEKMIRALDTPSVFSEAEVLVVSLKKANATQLAAILQNMLKPGAQGEWTTEARELQEQIRRLKIQGDNGQTVLLDLTKPIKIMSDPVAGAQGANRLLLTSTADNLKALATVVGMMDTVALGEGVDVKIIRLERADADAVAQTLNSVFSQGQKLATGPGGKVEPEGSGKALVNPLNVALDARNNAIVLSGHKESIELAEKIIGDLDKQLERFITEVRLFQLKYASASKILPLLQAVFAEGPAVPGSAGLQTQVTRLRTALDGAEPKSTEQPRNRAALIMQADETANVIIAAARSDMLPLIQDVLKQLDVPAASGLSTVRLFALKHADPQVVQKVINDLYTGSRAAQVRSEDKPTVTIDDRTGTLIVAGPERTFAVIESLLMTLDKELPVEMRDIRILPLEHSDATDLAAQLQKLLDARITQKSAMGRGQAEALRVLVVGEPRSNSLLIGGSKDSFELVQALATQLDKAPTALSGKIRQVTLQYADARNIATALNQLFTQRYQSAKSPEVQRNKPIIVPDPRSNSLLIGAAVDDNQVVDELLLKLDKKLDDPALQLGVLALKHNDSAKVATTIESIFAARLQSRTPPGEQPSPQDRVKIETDPLNNALIVSASRDNLELIQSLLQKLDVEPTVIGGVLTTFTLQFADAQRVANILKNLVDQGLYRPGAIVTSTAPGSGKSAGGRDALAVSVDPRSNTLIVSASPENLAVVRTVIAQIDTKDFAELGNVRLYPLKHARASSLATVLEQFFRAKQQSEATAVNAAERRMPVTIVPDERSNSILVTGTKEGFDVIDRLLLQLDGEDARARLNFRVFALKQATATKLQDTLRQLFVNRPTRIKGEPPEPISVVADSWVNALIVGASVDDMGMVSSLIERLDSDQGGPGLAVQVLPLAKADARKVAQTVQSLYREGASGTTALTAQPVSVSADDRINAIVVSAGEGDVKRIAELVKKLDTDQVARVAEIRVFALRYARAESLSTILNTALNTKPAPLTDGNPNAQSVLQFIARNGDGSQLVTSALKESVLITPDSRVNSLIVSAPVDYMGLLEQIITKLDNSTHQKAKIKVFALQNADARQTSELLAGLFRLQQAPGQNPNQRSVQYTLVRAGSGDVDDERELASAILGTDEQTALTVTIDPRTNSLLIGGTEDYVSLVSQIIESLDSSEAQERKTEVYRLRNAQAQEVATAVRTFLDQERQRVSQVLGQEAVGTAQRLLEREIAVVAEPISNTLLLSASPRYFDSIRNLIKELDMPQPQVLIQVLVAEVSLDSALDLGLEWTYNGTPFAAGIELSEAKWIETGFSSAVTGGDYSFLFRALEDKGRLEVLSRPQIVTADNKPAVINIGQTIPLITDSRVTERGDTINSFRYENVGVNLRVTPRISPDGFVKLEVGTTNSTISSSTVRVNANAEVPIINQRIANTTVSVQSGQSILIGGLIGTLDDKRTRKVPVIGDIPILGYLFRSNRNRQERRELLILLTPQVLAKSELASKVFDPREVTDEQLRNSRIKDEIKRDKVQKQILDPVFPPDQKFEEKKSLPKPEAPPAKDDESVL